MASRTQAAVGPQAGKSVTERLREFFVQHCEPPRSGIPAEQQQDATSQSTNARALWTQEVDCIKLLDKCPELGRQMYGDTLDLLNSLRAESAALCLEAEQPIRPDDISIRFTHLPTLSMNLPSLPPRRGQLVQVCGSIVRMSTKRVVPYAYRLMCPRCHNVVEDYTHPFDRAAQPKRKCENATCKNEELQVVGQVWMDYAECRLQQRSNQSGRLPRSVLVTLDDELSTKCGVGQFVEVIGILHPTWRHLYPLSRPAIEPAIWAINVLPMEAYRGAAIMAGNGVSAAATVNQQRRRNGQQGERPKFSPEAFFTSFLKNKRRRGVALVNSTAPQLSGLFAPRMSLLLSALNGTSMAGKTAMHIRSTIHCLFVGDPSTGKSQLLRFAASVAPRSTSTTGMGSTSAGLTVAATKEHGEWVLEPGALVLSDGGVCVIDELRTVSPADRASLHEAMEQQTISVAKGGLVTKLRTACSVLSACNPPPLKRNGRAEIGVGGPLLSRFDFIFLLWDTPQSSVDDRIADHVLSCNVASRRPDPPLLAEELARYLWWLRAQYAVVDGPFLSDAAADLLGRYYEIQRQRGASPSLEDAVPVTIRLLESLVRITQAHAKLHLQSVCTLDDAAMAVFLMERSAHSLKVPLRALGPDLYSSTGELDELFLNDSAECLAMQDAVLEAIVDVVQRFSLPAVPPPPASGGECYAEGSPAQAPSFDDCRKQAPFQQSAAPPHASGEPANQTAPDDASYHVESCEGQERANPGVERRCSQQNLRTAIESDSSSAGRMPHPSQTKNPFGSMSQYERCQLAGPAAHQGTGTQSSSDELAEHAADLLSFRRHRMQQKEPQSPLRRQDFFAAESSTGPVTSAVTSTEVHNSPRGTPLVMSWANTQTRQEEFVRQSAEELQKEVNRTSSVPYSACTYGVEVYGGGDSTFLYKEAHAWRANAARKPTQQGDAGAPHDARVLTRESPSAHSLLSSPNPVLFSNVETANSQSMGTLPPCVQQTAPFWTAAAASQGNAPATLSLGTVDSFGLAITSQTIGGYLGPTGDQQLCDQLSRQPLATQGSQTAKKRKRSAEDIMRSLRFQP